MIFLVKATIKDIPTLKQIQSAAFAEDLKLYKDVEKSPANNSEERIELMINRFDYYLIKWNDQIIGGAIIRQKSEEHFDLLRIFINEENQNKGIGKQMMKEIENLYPTAKLWTLDTPHLNYRNQHFYESLGYVKVREVVVTEYLTLFDYEKRL
jgi:ribosomal protein S18 acetylase RimI-like enzyme